MPQTSIKRIPKDVFIASLATFSLLIIASNYLVQFPINNILTYGALTYPFTFLLADVLSEKYNKQQVMLLVRLGILVAFFPSMFLAEFRIALASVLAFFTSQQFDVLAFFYLKNRFPKLWWLRSGGATAFSQLLDALIFFHVAFLGVLPYWQLITLMLGDYAVKLFFAFANTPLFYIFAFKMQRILGIFR